MKTHRKTEQNQATDLTAELASEVLCELAIAHDRYTVAFHVTTCQMWVIDSTGQDKPRGPVPGQPAGLGRGPRTQRTQQRRQPDSGTGHPTSRMTVNLTKGGTTR